MCLLWNLPFFKMVPPKTFFLSSHLGLIMTQQASIPVNCFMAWGWHTSGQPISKVHTVGKGPSAAPSTWRHRSHLTNSFLTDTKCLAKNQQQGTISVLFWCLCQKFSLSLLYFNKTLLHKKLQVVKPPEVTNSGLIYSLQQQPFRICLPMQKFNSWAGKNP